MSLPKARMDQKNEWKRRKIKDFQHGVEGRGYGLVLTTAGAALFSGIDSDHPRLTVSGESAESKMSAMISLA